MKPKASINKLIKIKELHNYIQEIDKQIEMFKKIKKDLFNEYDITPENYYFYKSKYFNKYSNLESIINSKDMEYILEVQK